MRTRVKVTLLTMLAGLVVALAPSSASLSSTTAPAAPTFQGNPAHSGISPALVHPPLRSRWTKSLPGKAMFPVVADGRVFVVTNDVGIMRLHAFEVATGQPLWFRTFSAGDQGQIGYGSGRLFAVTENCTVLSLDPASGGTRWVAKEFADEYSCTAPPVVRKGTVFVVAAAATGVVTARNALSGRFLWRRTTGVSAQYDAAVATPDAVYVSGLVDVRAFRYDGTRLWAVRCCGQPPPGGMAAYYRGRLYVRHGAGVLSADTGEQVGELASEAAFAFAGDAGLRLAGGDLEAVDLATGTVRWTYSSPANIVIAPLVVNGYAYVGAKDGQLTALRTSDGHPVWTTQAPARITGSELIFEHVGFAASHGVLVVPAGRKIVVYEPAGTQ
jgi:outer membrane protein assembly factor BamB